MLAIVLSILAVVISCAALFNARRGYLREKARRRGLEARYPHLVDRTTEK